MSAPLADVVASAVGAIPSAGLAETVRQAALQDRVDRKYVLGAAAAAELLHTIAGPGVASLLALEIDGSRSFAYRSVYFDTPTLEAFLATVHGRPQRAKVRTRYYASTASCMLEVKVRDRRGRTVKHRAPYAVADQQRLTGAGTDYVRACLHGGPFGRLGDAELAPALSTEYRRSTLWNLGGDLRLTIDTNLRCTDAVGASIGLPDAIIVEVKSRGPVTVADRWLWGLGARPVAFSKYGVGMAALDRTLPANRWHRVLSACFGTSVAQRDRTRSSGPTGPGRPAPSGRNPSEFQGWVG